MAYLTKEEKKNLKHGDILVLKDIKEYLIIVKSTRRSYHYFIIRPDSIFNFFDFNREIYVLPKYKFIEYKFLKKSIFCV